MIEITFRSDTAIYGQIADHLRRQVALGKLQAGDRLPAIRELAREYSLNPGTVARAYYELEREGIISTRRGGGSFVSAGASTRRLAEQQQKHLETTVEKAILEALGQGFAVEDIESAFVTRLADWRERRRQTGKKPASPVAQPVSQIRFYGSHDLAIELLASHMGTVYPALKFSTSFVGSLAGMMALALQEADIAGAHLLDTESGDFNIPFIRKLLPNDIVVLMNLMQRTQGLITGKGNPKKILNLGDFQRPGITMVNRQSGSGTRVWLDAHLLNLGISPLDIKGYENEETTHVAVAAAIAQGRADAGIGTESAAYVASLNFIPLFRERYDLIAHETTFAQPKLQKIRDTVLNQSFQKMLRTMPGYDLTDTGKITIISPKNK
ncbi:MAG: substrate-binding domain-containing protein [Dehalococcoidales bacterium]|nr:substrate-binding domain-containing protein [Dehalococcoidales bacterium]